MKTIQMDITEYLEAIEEIEIFKDHLKCWTDKSHGIYFELYPDGRFVIEDCQIIDKDAIEKYAPDILHGLDVDSIKLEFAYKILFSKE